jgi:hypothetical protein
MLTVDVDVANVRRAAAGPNDVTARRAVDDASRENIVVVVILFLFVLLLNCCFGFCISVNELRVVRM